LDLLSSIAHKWEPTIRSLKSTQYKVTGFKILGDYVKGTEFEWEHATNLAVTWAFVARHLACSVFPEVELMVIFSHFASIMLNKLAHQMFQQPLTLINLQNWVMSKKGWSRGKKLKYLENIRKQLLGLLPLKGAYLGTCKKKEVNFHRGDLEILEGWVEGQSSRHRFYVTPSDAWCGLLTYIQAYIFRDLKCLGEFCHGLNSKQLKKRIFKNVSRLGDPARVKSVSLDGSAFDSTQHWSIIRVVDFVFWKLYRPRLVQILTLMRDTWHWPIDVELVADGLVDSACEEIATIFLELHNETVTSMSPAEIQVWKSNFPTNYFSRANSMAYPEQGVFVFYIKGTTYSGNPVRTTLGNTIRSILYVYFYAYRGGLFDPDTWKESGSTNAVWCIAAGDDVIIWTLEHNLRRLQDGLWECTTDDKNFTGEHGLG